MKHCEKCLYYEKCKAEMGEAPDDTFTFFPYNEDCPHFKNKADFVETEKYNELRENFIGFACSGVNNLAPYCKNRCAECVDARGWCRYGDGCKGFNPDGEGRDT